MSKLTEPSIEVVRDETFASPTHSFLRVRHVTLRNRKLDGMSREYYCDFVERPMGLDAIVALPYVHADGNLKILLRDCLRPPMLLGRPDGTSVWFREAVAGIIEVGDVGDAGLRHRVVAEVAEEAGYSIAPHAVEWLGAPVIASPGALPEKWHLACVCVDGCPQHPPAGDGSPMEEGASVIWLDLAAALAACASGAISDAKTELLLRRFAEREAARGSVTEPE